MEQRYRGGRAQEVYWAIGAVVAGLSGHHGDHRHILVITQISPAFAPLVLEVKRDVPSDRVQKSRHVNGAMENEKAAELDVGQFTRIDALRVRPLLLFHQGQ